MSSISYVSIFLCFKGKALCDSGKMQSIWNYVEIQSKILLSRNYFGDKIVSLKSKKKASSRDLLDKY